MNWVCRSRELQPEKSSPPGPDRLQVWRERERGIRVKNRYEVRGDVAVIFLKRKDGSELECLVDTDDLPRVMEFSYAWSPHWDKHTQSFYAEGKTSGSRKEGPKRKRQHFSLHRWLLNPPKGTEVDHIDHKTLDNRRHNLRVLPKGGNQQNYAGARRHNQSSGVRGVSWNYKVRKWVAKFRLNRKDYHVGCFDTVEEAARAVTEARAIAMPYSLDALEGGIHA